MARLHRLEARVKDALERSGLEGRGLVVAVSGGPDSICLLHCLHALGSRLELSLHVAHLNHDFRGEEAEEDARFVAQVAQGLDLPATVQRVDPLDYQKRRKISSFEAAARELRYDFLARVAQNAGAGATALGHTADDQAETVLMHILRGSGIDGLRGMAETSSWQSPTGGPGITLFRPLLATRRAETYSYCQSLGLSFREDTSNLDPRFSRNRVRLALIPALQKHNPRIVEGLVRLARQASREVDYLEGAVDEAWSQLATEVDGALELDRQALATLHPALRRRVLRRAYVKLSGDARRLEESHLEAMASLVEAARQKQVVLPRGLSLVSEYHKLRLGGAAGVGGPLPELEGEHPLSLPGPGETTLTHLPGWRVGIRRLAGPVESPPGDPLAVHVDLSQVGTTLWVRKRMPGDRFHPAGMAGEKKLQDFFVDQKVPRSWRDRVPLVVSERGIVWVVGYRVAEWARHSETSEEVLHIQFVWGGQPA